MPKKDLKKKREKKKKTFKGGKKEKKKWKLKKEKKKRKESNRPPTKRKKNQRQTLKLKDGILNTLIYKYDSNPIVPSPPPITFFPQIQNKVHSVIERKCGGRPSNGCAWATIDD